MVRGGWIGWGLWITVAVGCTSTGGLTICPTGNYLTESARQSLEHSPIGANLPRELARSVLPDHYLQPGDVLVIEPARLDSDVRLPADQRVMADGTVDLGAYGRVVVAGKTIEEAERLIESRILGDNGEEIRISVRLVEPQQVYYVLGEVNSPGAIPLVGSETVLDAILAAGGLTSRASHCDLMLVRPTAPPSCRVTLPICYAAITQLGDTTTNYQLQPGDRVFVATRTLCEELKFWGSRHGCDRCQGAQCPCHGPEVSTYQNPIVETLPSGPVPIASPSSADRDDLPVPAIEPLPRPPRASGPAPQASTPTPSTSGPAPRESDPSDLAPLPALPELLAPPQRSEADPFEGDEFFRRPSGPNLPDTVPGGSDD